MDDFGILSNALVIAGLLFVAIPRGWVIIRNITRRRPLVFDLFVLSVSLALALSITIVAYYFAPSVPALPFFAGLLIITFALFSYVYPLRKMFGYE